MTAAQLFVSCLEVEGVTHVFALPGEENLALLDALRQSSIRVITTRHEQTAGFMAAAYGRLTGRPGVCLTTLGPGATNALTAVAQAQLGGMPMVVITAQKALKDPHQGLFQLVDTLSIYRPVCKYQRQLVSPEVIPAAVREAFRQAQYERPGVAHLELPEDIASEKATQRLVPIKPTVLRRAGADAKALALAIRALERAKRPVILVGPGANRQRIRTQLTNLVQRFNLPVLATPMGKGVFDERLPQFLGTTALTSGDQLHQRLHQCDLILSLGHDVCEKPAFDATRQTVIDLDFEPSFVTPAYHPTLEVIGDIARSLEIINNLLAPGTTWDQAFFTHWRREWLAQQKKGLTLTGKVLTPRALIAALRESLPEDSTVALDNGLYKLWFAQYYLTYSPNTLLLDNALATMGAGLATGMVANLLSPDQPTVVVAGDGGLLMSLADLGTPSELKVRMTVVVLRDNYYGMVRWKQQQHGYPSFAMQVPNPRWAMLANSFGLANHHAKSARHLQQLLRKTTKHGGVHLIEVPFSYGSNRQLTA